MKFLVRKIYKGKNLVGMDIEIPEGTYVDADNKYILWNRLPVCIYRSQTAKDYFIWADDGFEFTRLRYENVILFNDRERLWKKEIPIYDNEGKFIKNEVVYNSTRFTPEEVKFMKENFSKFLVDGDGFVFNDLFYVGSDIKEIEKIVSYLNR